MPILNQILDIAQQIAPLVLTPKAQTGQAKGLAAITQAGNLLIQNLQQLASMPVTAQTLAQANELAAALSNPTYFYQAKSGKDAEALINFKTQARNIISQMQQSVSIPLSTSTNPVVTMNGITTTNSNQLINGVDNIYLFAGAGLVAYLVLK